MERIKLDANELQQIFLLVKAFSSANEKLNEYSNRLDELEAEKSELTSKLRDLQISVEELRNQEKIITDNLTTKYGPFKLNMETFELELT